MVSIMSGSSGREKVQELVAAYEANRAEYQDPSYQEAEVREDFLNPLFEALGWDVNNHKNKSPSVRDVKKEARQQTDQGTTRKPDYEFRDDQADPAFYVEAKKPSVSLDSDGPARQTREYGWTSNLTISILSNFERLIIYDCKVPVDEDDDPHVGRLQTYHYTEYVDKFSEIVGILSREAVLEGAIEDEFGDPSEAAERKTFDELFLEQLERWRQLLAEDVVENNDNINNRDLNYLVHRVLNRVIFLRVAEDRGLERHEQLKELDEYTYQKLEGLFEEAEERYNSELFDLLEDYSAENIDIDAEVVGTILEELYYPHSPYNFAVVESDIIGRIYDLFLGKELRRDGDELVVEEKPEVLHSQGAVSTPDAIVTEIVEESVAKKIEQRNPHDLDGYTVADICCGSGVFLTKAFEVLVSHYRDWHAEHEPEADILIEVGDELRLKYEEQKRILEEHIRGLDIDPLAIEVTRFNLTLKLLEDQPSALIDQYERTRDDPLVGELGGVVKHGNALVSTDYYTNFDVSDDTAYQVNPFDFESEFSSVMEQGGFNAIIGNPPYIRIQKMREYTPDSEVEYYSDVYQYETAQENNYDKYCLFIERALDLVCENGDVGYIVSQKFLTIEVGRQVRKLIADRESLRKIVHFGVNQVFENHSTYTCLLFLNSGGTDNYIVETDFDYKAWKEGDHNPSISTGETDTLSDEPWSFVGDAVDDLFSRIRGECEYNLDDVADVFVGLQTSRNSAYFLKDYEYRNGFYHFTDYKGNSQKVEEALVRDHLHTYNKWKPSIRFLDKVISNQKLIYPYEDGEVISPDEMQDSFPEAWKYFTTDEVKKDLKTRDLYDTDVDGAFYRYGRKQGFGKVEEDKIVVQVLTLEPRYGLDRDGITNTAGGNGPFYNIKSTDSLPDDSDRTVDLDLRYLMAVLSHPVIEAMVRARSTFFRDGYYSHGGQYIEHVPIKAIDESSDEEQETYQEIISDVQTHIDLSADLRDESDPSRQSQIETRMESLRNSIENKVSSLYDLSAEQIEIAESV